MAGGWRWSGAAAKGVGVQESRMYLREARWRAQGQGWGHPRVCSGPPLPGCASPAERAEGGSPARFLAL